MNVRSNPNWRVLGITGVALGLILSVVMGFSGAFSPSRANATTFTADDCAVFLGYPDRDSADQAFLNACVHAFRPYIASTPTESASPSSSPTMTPTTSPSPTPSATPTPVVHDTYYVDGNQLKDPNGARVIPRGVENSFWNVSWLPYASVTEAAKTGANTFRMLPFYLNTPPCSGCGKLTVAQMEDLIQRGIAAHMLVDIAIDGGATSVYLRPEIKTMLMRYSSKIVIHAKGESYESTDAAWRDASITAIQQMRAYGYTMPLYIMSRQGGRDLRAIINEGANVVAADPLHNTLLGWQAYWGSNGGYQSQQQMTLTEAMNSAASLPFPVQVGLAYRSDPWASSQITPFQDLMRQAQELSLGWLWWDWRTGADNLTTDGFFGHWATAASGGAPCAAPCVPSTALGRLVSLDDPNSISHTAVRTAYMLAA